MILIYHFQSKYINEKISVIIPTYNREKLIRNSIKSVLNQTYQNLEIIVVDDGSIDKTKNGYSLFTEGKTFTFENDNPSKILLSYKADQTKEHIESQIGTELKNALILNNTVLDEGDKTFTLYGNLSETINDKEIMLYLKDDTMRCSVNNLGNKSYEFTCTPNRPINEHLEGKYGITRSGKYIWIIRDNVVSSQFAFKFCLSP
jgi:hypothetical protein